MVEPTKIPLFSELESDAFTELINIGVGRAAVSLRELVQEEVLLSVPRIELVNRTEAVEMLHRKGLASGVAVHQLFDGDLNGRALLIFPSTKSLELVRAVTRADLSLDDLIELEPEALAETGNIILNGCLASIANTLHRTLRVSLPEILRGEGTQLLDAALPPEAGEVVIFFYVDFTIQSGDIRGYIAMLMDLPSVATLKVLLQELINRSSGSGSGSGPISAAPRGACG
jgi:chemotaxis protein CheC